MLNRKRVGLLAGFAAVSAMAPIISNAATNIYSTGFEPGDGFNAGDALNSDAGWNGGAGGTSYPLAYIQQYTSPTLTNTQYVSFTDTAIDAGPYTPATAAGGYTFYNPPLPLVTPGSDKIDIVFAMEVNASNPATDGDAVFGVEADDASLAAQVGIGVDAATGALEVYSANGTVNPQTPNPLAGGLGTWNNYELQLDYGSQTFSVYEEPDLAAAFTDVVDTGTFSATTLGGVYLDSFNGGATAATGTAAFDNLAITEVPEPASLSLMVGGVAIASLRRRRQVQV